MLYMRNPSGHNCLWHEGINMVYLQVPDGRKYKDLTKFIKLLAVVLEVLKKIQLFVKVLGCSLHSFNILTHIFDYYLSLKHH